jgi:hypothetical protein
LGGVEQMNSDALKIKIDKDILSVSEILKKYKNPKIQIVGQGISTGSKNLQPTLTPKLEMMK